MKKHYYYIKYDYRERADNTTFFPHTTDHMLFTDANIQSAKQAEGLMEREYPQRTIRVTKVIRIH